MKGDRLIGEWGFGSPGSKSLTKPESFDPSTRAYLVPSGGMGIKPQLYDSLNFPSANL